jgi:uncharacterized protein
MQWLNEPASWQRTGDVLRVSVDPGTDFWRTTGYGYIHDNGHVYGEPLPGDLDVSVRVRGAFANQYDQAGIMLRADEHTWLKTGLEFFEGRPRLSTVLTMGCSSWMVADLPPGTDEVTLRVSRRGDAVEVRYAAGDGAAELAALVFMPPDREMLAGIVCAAPEGSGFSVAFHDLRITGREWGGQEAAGDAEWAGGSVPAAGWAPDEAAAAGAGWNGGTEGWGGERADGGAPAWAGGGPDEAKPGWARAQPARAAPGWAGGGPGEAVPGWARSEPGQPVPGRAEKEPGVLASGGAGKKADDRGPGWDVGTPGEVTSGWAKEIAARAPVNGGGELTREGSVDWAEPQASEPAEDWERLSLSVSGTGSWNAFAAATPAKREPAEAADNKAAGPATDQAAGRPGRDSGDRAGEPVDSTAGDKAKPALAVTGPPAAAKPAGRNGRGRNKAKQPADPSDRPAPTDAADEWISLLTADSSEELSGWLSGPGADRPSRPRSRLPGQPAARPGWPGPAVPAPGASQPGDMPWPE